MKDFQGFDDFKEDETEHACEICEHKEECASSGFYLMYCDEEENENDTI